MIVSNVKSSCNFECLVQPDGLSTQCSSVWLNKIWNVILKNNEKVKCFSEINSIMFLCILTIKKNNRLIYTTLSICLWVDFYVLQNSISFHIKYFLFRKSNGLRPCFWCLHQYFICPFFSSKHRYISMRTQNMIIKVHLLKTWKFELSVSGLLDCFIRILLSSINKIKNNKILIQQKFNSR